MMQTKQNNLSRYLLCGMLGCLLMGGSDWLMIYGDTAFEGNLAWLTVGAAQVAPWRNTLALVLAFPAVACYEAALFRMRNLFSEQKHRKIYSALTAFGITPWLCLHLFYIMILYQFGWMQGNGYGKISFAVCEALFQHFVWLIPVAEAVMLAPFLYFLYLFATGKSDYPRWMALNNPLVWYVVLKTVSGFLPDCAARLAFVNGLMSESMLIWFLIFLLVKPERQSR